MNERLSLDLVKLEAMDEEQWLQKLECITLPLGTSVSLPINLDLMIFYKLSSSNVLRFHKMGWIVEL